MSDGRHKGRYRGYRRTKPYVKDSTVGLSRTNDPQTYKTDANVQVRIQSRTLATLSRWLDDTEVMATRSLSEVIKIPLEMLVEYLVDSGKVEMVDNPTEARDMLWMKYRVNLNTGGRGKKNVHHNVHVYERRQREVSGMIDGRYKVMHEKKAVTVKADKEPAITEEDFAKAREYDRKESKEKMANTWQRLKDEGHVQVINGKEVVVMKQSIANSVPKPTPATPATGVTEVTQVTEVTSVAEVDASTSVNVEDDTPRQRTQEELDELERERAERDREQLEMMDKAFEEGPSPSMVVGESVESDDD